MRPSRNRAWGHPVLIAFLERLAQKLPGEAGWPGLLVGDIAQPRGGPMLTGHGSHQIGLDVDIWLTPMPNRRLSPAERDAISATDVVARNGMDIDPTVWTPQHRLLLRGGRARALGGARFCQRGNQARTVPRGPAGAGLDCQDSAVVGTQLPFPCQAFLPERQPSMSWPSTAAARRRLRQGPRLVVHRRGASPATVTTSETAAAWQPAAGLCRARRCADRTRAAASRRSAMKQSGPAVAFPKAIPSALSAAHL